MKTVKYPTVKLSGGGEAALVMGEGNTWKHAYIRIQDAGGSYLEAIDNDMKTSNLKKIAEWIKKIIAAQKRP